MKFTPKELVLRAQREAKWAKAMARMADGKQPVTIAKRPIVTPELKANVTQLERRGGRAKVHGSAAAKQAAYRARRKGNG